MQGPLPRSRAPRLPHLKHGDDVGVPGLHQLPPGGEVAVGQEAPGLQQAKGMVLGRGQGSGGRSEVWTEATSLGASHLPAGQRSREKV